MVPASYDSSLWHSDVFGVSFPGSVYSYQNLVLSLLNVGRAVCLVEEPDL